MSAGAGLLIPPATRPRRCELTTADALMRLFDRRPNEAITIDAVAAELGRPVSRAVIHKIVTRMRRNLTIEAGHGRSGGYTHLLPVPTQGRGSDRCVNCAHRVAGREGNTCRKNPGRQVGLNDWCAGWGHE